MRTVSIPCDVPMIDEVSGDYLDDHFKVVPSFEQAEWIRFSDFLLKVLLADPSWGKLESLIVASDIASRYLAAVKDTSSKREFTLTGAEWQKLCDVIRAGTYDPRWARRVVHFFRAILDAQELEDTKQG